jgi:hypothetical protein
LRGKPKAKGKPLNALVYRNFNIKINFKKIRRQDVEWINMAQGGGTWIDFVDSAMNSGLQKCGEFLDCLRSS